MFSLRSTMAQQQHRADDPQNDCREAVVRPSQPSRVFLRARVCIVVDGTNGACKASQTWFSVSCFLNYGMFSRENDGDSSDDEPQDQSSYE